MPARYGKADGRLHELYAQAHAARQHSRLLAGQLQAAQNELAESWQLVQVAWGRAEQIRVLGMAARADQDQLRYSATARLRARLATMPVIEQAKGIIMARYGWREDQAFDALRRASQRQNVKYGTWPPRSWSKRRMWPRPGRQARRQPPPDRMVKSSRRRSRPCRDRSRPRHNGQPAG